MRVIVAGGTGFLGRHVTAALRAAGHPVQLLARGTRRTAETEGVEIVCADVAAGALPSDAMRGADAIVNLIGIKREEGAQTFERVHVEATRHLLDTARELGIRRLVHVSVVCSRPDPASGYHDTKWRAEELVRASGLSWTILKPGVIYGPGDDMVTHLVKMIRFAPIFPVVGRGDSLLQPVHARDVAAAVVGALGRETTIGRAYDVVGPEPMTLRAVVRTVAEGTGLGLWIVGTPHWLQRVAVRLMTALFRNPLSTPAQLQMLIDGLAGDPDPARHELGVEPAPFTPAAVLELEGPIPPLFGFSPRLVAHREHATWLRARAGELPRSALLLAIAVGSLLALTPLIPNVWHRMALYYAALIPVAVTGLRLGWAELLRPSLGRLTTGALAAVVLYVLAGAGFALVGVLSPDLASRAGALYAWKDQVPAWVALLLMIAIIIPGEEIVWRGAVTLPLAARLGPWAGLLLGAIGFAAAHLRFGSPLLLLAALGCGSFWGWLAVKTRSLVPPIVCHLLWDLTVLFWLPY